VSQTHHFIETALGESEPVCRLEDGIMALRLALAAGSLNRQAKLFLSNSKIHLLNFGL